ncbi:methyl-accepting chemotaxis protein [Tepidimonas thermarum]|nr:methyl-accepting chemotaxis protein [Tepidimonas thermarum]
MRNLPFAPKMALLGALLLAAVAALALAYYSTMLGNIAFSAKERDGVHDQQRIYPALLVALDVRREATAHAAGDAAADPQAAQARLQAALQTLVQQAAVRDGGSQRALQAVQQAAQTRASDAVTALDAHSAMLRALVALAAQVCDDSNLTLDPGVHTYYIMDAVCFRLPDTIDRAGATQARSLAILRAGERTPALAEPLVRDEALVTFHFEQMQAGLAKTIGARPETASTIALQQALAPVRAFYQRIGQNVLHAEALDSSQVGALAQAGHAAVQAQAELAQRLLPLLDALLAERLDGMKREMWIRTAVIATLVVVSLYFGVAFYLVNRGGTRVIQEHLELMARGDLREAPPKPWGKDEPAQIIVNLRVAYDALHALIRKVRHAARDLASASEEIAHASRDLGARTEQAAATLEEQASAMEQIGSQVQATAQRAHEAAQFAQTNARVAEDSRGVVDSVVGTMRDIQSSSQKIADITQVIDSIAFQTNILALNAAVEAARAGEAGRGFAVVAGEVRSLAQRSAEAARQIKALIEESSGKVQAGVQVVEQAGTTMGSLVRNAETINGYMGEMAAAAHEQSDGVAHSVQAIQHLDASTQQNAALVEQTSAAAVALEQQAQRLMDEIGRFRL